MEYKSALVGDIANMQSEIDRLNNALDQMELIVSTDGYHNILEFDKR